jgi:hypothetical protein
VIAEKTGDWVSLQDAIKRAALLRGIVLPEIFWKDVPNVAGTGVLLKAARAKGMEPLVADGRLLFSAGIPILESCFQQLVRFDGVKRSGSSPNSKDDFVDALSLLVQTWGPREIRQPPSEAQLEFEAEMEIQRILRAQHDRIFGNAEFAPQQQYIPPEPDRPGGLIGTLGRFGMVRKR